MGTSVEIRHMHGRPVQEIIDFFIVQLFLEKHAEFQEHRNLAGGLKVGIVSSEISCSNVMLGC